VGFEGSTGRDFRSIGMEGLAAMKPEFDRDAAVARYLKLDRRWFKFKKVRREMDRIMGKIIAYDIECHKRELEI